MELTARVESAWGEEPEGAPGVERADGEESHTIRRDGGGWWRVVEERPRRTVASQP